MSKQEAPGKAFAVEGVLYTMREFSPAPSVFHVQRYAYWMFHEVVFVYSFPFRFVVNGFLIVRARNGYLILLPHGVATTALRKRDFIENVFRIIR